MLFCELEAANGAAGVCGLRGARHIKSGYEVGRFRFDEDSLEDGATVQIDAHLQSLVPVEQVEGGDANRQCRRRRDPSVAAARRQESAGPEEGVTAGWIATAEVEVAIQSVAQD
ncbi:MAG: hypothetical protein ACRDS9_17830, partial [Pseudonocardiaceae bacterium]